MAESIQDFIAKQGQSEAESSGAFSLAPGQLLEKLGSVLIQPQFWVLKLVQAAVSLPAKSLNISINRRKLTFELELSEDFELVEPSEFVELTNRSRSHQHLLLGALCAANLHTTEDATLTWSLGAEVASVSIQNKNFAFQKSGGSSKTPFLEFCLNRRSVTTMERLFRRADFAAEFQLLCLRTYLCPIPVRIDGRWLESGAANPWGGQIVSRVAYSRPELGPALSNSPRLQGNVSLWTGLPCQKLEPNQQREVQAYLEVSFFERLGKKKYELGGACLRAWVLDGVVIEVEQFLAGRGDLGLILFLPADDLQTDLSSLNLVDGEDKQARLAKDHFPVWQSMVLRELIETSAKMDSAKRTQTSQAKQTLKELQALSPFSKDQPIHWDLVREATLLRAQELREHHNLI